MSKIGLLDCNNFFVSCERVFDPSLKNKPVIVLSGNDGCVVSRSNEVKKFDIKVGVPVFKIRNIVKAKKIILKSTNFMLYRDMSNRVMSILKELADEVEIYSIDEAFFDFPQNTNKKDFSNHLKKIINQYTGIPVSIGIAETKTLAKIANRIAKNSGQTFEISESNRREILKVTPVKDVWGVGPQTTKKLERMNILNAWQLASYDKNKIKSLFNINLLDTIDELNGKSAILKNVEPEIRKSIVSSRSLSQTITTKSEILSELNNHLEEVIQTLRFEKLFTRKMTIYISTSLFSKNKYTAHQEVKLQEPTNDFFLLVKHLEKNINLIFKSGFQYKKTSIKLSDISDHNFADAHYQRNLDQQNLFDIFKK